MLEDGGIECGGDGIAPLGRKESESRLSIRLSSDICSSLSLVMSAQVVDEH